MRGHFGAEIGGQFDAVKGGLFRRNFQLGLKNSIEHLAELAKKYPEASEMFAKYLHLSLNLVNIGYYERVAESALQYSERLLETHEDMLPKKPKEIAIDLVYKYKDHGFVIDKEEAEQIFSDKVIKSNTEEYDLGNAKE